MKQKLYTITDLDFSTKFEDLENIFNVHMDNDFDFYRPNINETIMFDFDEDDIGTYIPNHPLHWTTLSYKLYGTVRLAWLLMKLNNIGADKCFKRVEPGVPILAVNKDTAQSIISQMANF